MNPQKLLKQMQQAQERIQREIAEMKVEAGAGGGMVKVVMGGQKQLLELRLDPEVVSKDDVEMLQDLVLAAEADAIRASRQLEAEKMAAVTGGLKIPGL